MHTKHWLDIKITMFFKYFKWALLWAVLIFILLLMPDHNPDYTSWLGKFYLDKVIHTGLFFTQSFFVLYGFIQLDKLGKSKVMRSVTAFILAALYGGILELMQSKVSEGRSTDINDFVANAIGALLGVVFYSFALKLFERFVPLRLRK